MGEEGVFSVEQRGVSPGRCRQNAPRGPCAVHVRDGQPDSAGSWPPSRRSPRSPGPAIVGFQRTATRDSSRDQLLQKLQSLAATHSARSETARDVSAGRARLSTSPARPVAAVAMTIGNGGRRLPGRCGRLAVVTMMSTLSLTSSAASAASRFVPPVDASQRRSALHVAQLRSRSRSAFAPMRSGRSRATE